MLIADSSIVQRLDDPAVALCVLAMAGAGIKLGGFRSTLVGLGLLLALNAAIALCGWAAEMLIKLEVPPGYATLTGFLLLFLVGVVVTVGAMQAFIRESAARLSPITDGLLGSLAGVLGGVVIAAAVHISWSMATEVPEEYRFQPEEVEFPVGEAMLANVSGVAGSLSDELLERYQTGQWIGPLPEPEPEPDEGLQDAVDAGDTEDGAEGNSEDADSRPAADDSEDGEPAANTPPVTTGGTTTSPGGPISSDAGPVAR